jgi:GNAT superfamily N-acetyltransferase
MARRTALKMGNARLRLRTTTASDLPTLVRHRRRMWEEIGGRTPAELDRADPAYRRWVVREVRARRFIGFVIEDGRGHVAGSGAVWLQPAQPRPGRLSRLRMPYIMSMYTEPAFRGRGVASRIVRAMVRWSTLRGYHRIFLHASHAGRPVYAKLGFTDGSEMRLELPRRRARR